MTNVQELSNDKDDSITTITDVVSTMQMASNTSIHLVNAGINTMRQEITMLQAEVQVSHSIQHHECLFTEKY